MSVKGRSEGVILGLSSPVNRLIVKPERINRMMTGSEMGKDLYRAAGSGGLAGAIIYILTIKLFDLNIVAEILAVNSKDATLVTIIGLGVMFWGGLHLTLKRNMEDQPAGFNPDSDLISRYRTVALTSLAAFIIAAQLLVALSFASVSTVSWTAGLLLAAAIGFLSDRFIRLNIMMHRLHGLTADNSWEANRN